MWYPPSDQHCGCLLHLGEVVRSPPRQVEYLVVECVDWLRIDFDFVCGCICISVLLRFDVHDDGLPEMP